jgi:hypothetical protein
MSSLYDLQGLTSAAGDAPAKFPAARYASAPPFFHGYAEEAARAW